MGNPGSEEAIRMKTQMTMELKPRIAHIVQIGVLQRKLAVTKVPPDARRFKPCAYPVDSEDCPLIVLEGEQ